MEVGDININWHGQLEEVLSDEGERCMCYAWLHNNSQKLFYKAQHHHHAARHCDGDNCGECLHRQPVAF